MSYQQIVNEAMGLPLHERLTLLELLAHSIQQELWEKRGSRNGSSLNRVLGALKLERPAPSDEEIKNEYIDYLIEKYL
jgi:hypothetical protein